MAGSLPVRCPPAQRSFQDLYRISVPYIVLEVKMTSYFSPLAIKSTSTFSPASLACGIAYSLLWWALSTILNAEIVHIPNLQEGWTKFTGIIFQILIVNKEACLCLFQLCYCMKMSRLANNWNFAAAASCVFTSLLSFFGPTAAVVLVLSG